MGELFKILIDARLILNDTTGIGNYLTNLIISLLEVDQKNEYTILINESLETNHCINRLERKNLIKQKTRISAVRPEQQFVIPLKLINKAINVYHYPHFDLPLMQMFSSIVTIHDLKYIIFPSFFPEFGKLKKNYMNFFYRMAGMKSKKLIAVSESTKNDLIRLFNISTEKIVVVPLAADSIFKADPHKENVQSKLYKLGLIDPYFVVVGERRPHKNLKRIIKAFYIFKQRHSGNYKLIIVGKRYANYSQPEKMIEHLNLEDEVIFTGYVADELLPLYYQGATALIFASLYEGFGIPILEAMGCGTPVITSNVSSMPEVAGDAALYVNPQDPKAIAERMEQIIVQKEIRSDLIMKGLNRSKKFSWKKTAEQTLSIYEEVCLNAARR